MGRGEGKRGIGIWWVGGGERKEGGGGGRGDKGGKRKKREGGERGKRGVETRKRNEEVEQGGTQWRRKRRNVTKMNTLT